MDKIVEFLKENPIGSFATIKDGKPKVRPWGVMMMEDGKFYFTTANTKEVYKQLQETPYLEFTCSNKEGNWLRLSGEAIFTKDLEIKKKVM